LRSFVLGNVAEKGVEPGGDGAVGETLGAFKFKDLAEPVFGRRGGQGAASRVGKRLAHLFDSLA